MADLRAQVGNSIKRLRVARGLSQAELGGLISRELGKVVKEGQISDWESGRNLPRLDVVVAIATSLETSLDVLVHGEKSFADEMLEMRRRQQELDLRLRAVERRL